MNASIQKTESFAEAKRTFVDARNVSKSYDKTLVLDVYLVKSHYGLN